MPDIIILMGPQGAGKGTQALRLTAELGVPIIATGDILREVARHDTPLGREVRKIQSDGRLVPDEILARIINERTAREDCANGYVLDGFPRTLPQAELLEEIATQQGHRLIAIDIDVGRELLRKRLTGRRTCTKCGAIYNVYLKPSKVADRCDRDGEPLFTRSDDNEEAIAQRLALYDEKTRPLLEYYRRSGRLHQVSGSGSPREVFELITGMLNTVKASA